MTPADYFMAALTAWREARGEGATGMTAVLCVIRNRAQKRNSTPYSIVVGLWQFSSITAPRDPQLTLYPAATDPVWQQAQLLTQNVLNGETADITDGSTLYHDTSIGFPSSWKKNHTQLVVQLGKLIFYREI